MKLQLFALSAMAAAAFAAAPVKVCNAANDAKRCEIDILGPAAVTGRCMESALGYFCVETELMEMKHFRDEFTQLVNFVEGDDTCKTVSKPCMAIVAGPAVVEGTCKEVGIQNPYKKRPVRECEPDLGV